MFIKISKFEAKKLLVKANLYASGVETNGELETLFKGGAGTPLGIAPPCLMIRGPLSYFPPFFTTTNISS